MALSELVRREFGIISMALLALFSLVSRWLLILFLLSFVVSLVAVWIVHHTTLLYGRILISTGCGVGTLAALGFATQLPVVRGFSALFVGVFARRVDVPATEHDTDSTSPGTVLDRLLATNQPVMFMANTVHPFMRDLADEVDY